MCYTHNYIGYIPGYEIVNSNENDSFTQHLYLKYAKVSVSGITHDMVAPLRDQWGDNPDFFVGIPKDEARLVSVVYYILFFTRNYVF